VYDGSGGRSEVNVVFDILGIDWRDSIAAAD
jgi:hypothetical protein